MEETNHNVFFMHFHTRLYTILISLSTAHIPLHFEIWSTICLVLGWHHVKPLSEIFVENGSKCWRHRRNGSLFLVVDQEPVCAWECHLGWFRKEYPDVYRLSRTWSKYFAATPSSPLLTMQARMLCLPYLTSTYTPGTLMTSAAADVINHNGRKIRRFKPRRFW